MRAKAVARSEAILHPQRMAIIRSLASQPMTTAELAKQLPDIAQATLYRHLATLLAGGMVRVTDERRARGAVERTYALVDGTTILSAADLRDATPEDHYRYFAMFAAGLLGEFAKYVERPQIDLLADGVGYRELVLNLSNDELLEMLGELRAVLSARADNEPSAERTPRLIATVSMPVINPGEST